jgi:hypothetical protein
VFVEVVESCLYWPHLWWCPCSRTHFLMMYKQVSIIRCSWCLFFWSVNLHIWSKLNSEACAPLDPASSFLNHMMLEAQVLVFLSSVRLGTRRRRFRINLQKIWTPRTEVSMNNPSGVWQQSELMQITLSFVVFNVLLVGLFSAQTIYLRW